MSNPPSLLMRVDARSRKIPNPVGEALRHSLNILAGNEDFEVKTQRVHEKLAKLPDPKDRETVMALVEQFATADYVAPKPKETRKDTPPPLPFPNATPAAPAKT